MTFGFGAFGNLTFAEAQTSTSTRAFLVSAVQGVYAVTGRAAFSAHARGLTALAGAYTLAGVVATTTLVHVFVLAAGAYSLAGSIPLVVRIANKFKPFVRMAEAVLNQIRVNPPTLED